MQAEQLKKVNRDNSELKKLLAAAEGKEVPESQEELEALATKFRKSIAQSISSQMSYKRQSNKSRVSASFPNLTLIQLRCDVTEAPRS